MVNTGGINVPITADASELQREMRSAQTSLNTFRTTYKDAARAVGASTSEYSRAAKSIDRLRRETDPAFAATQRFIRAQQQVAQATRLNIITQEQGAAILSRYTAATANAGKATRNKGAIMQQVGFQVGDMATQIGMGTNALQAFSVQGSQLLGVLGPMGAVAGAVLAILGPLAVGFMKARDAQKGLTQSTEEYRNSLQRQHDWLIRVRDGENALMKVQAMREVEQARLNLRTAEAAVKLARENIENREKLRLTIQQSQAERFGRVITTDDFGTSRIEKLKEEAEKAAAELRQAEQVLAEMERRLAGGDFNTILGNFDKSTMGVAGGSGAGGGAGGNFGVTGRSASIVALEEQMRQEAELRKKYETDTNQFILNQRQQFNQGMTVLMQGLVEEGSALGKALFLAQKVIAIKDAIVATNVAAAKALAIDPTGALAARATALGYANVALIAAQTVAGFRDGGFTGNGGVNSIAGVVHGQEFVFDAASTRRIGVDNLEAMRSGRMEGVGGTITLSLSPDLRAEMDSQASRVVRVEQQAGSLAKSQVSMGRIIKQQARVA